MKLPTNSLGLKLPLTLICVAYVASHLPILAAGRIAPFHVIQGIALAWATWTLLVSDGSHRLFRQVFQQYRRLLLGAGALVLWSGLSLLWGTYGEISFYKFILLAAGVAFGAAVLFLLHSTRASFANIARLMICAGLALAAFCVWQFIGDNLGAPHWLTQINPSGHWDQIDFSRVNGLMEEPQYLTTVLLLPASLLYWRLSQRAMRWHWLGFLALDTALLLALSRGGFLAHGLLAILWLDYWVSQKKWSFVWRRFAAAIAALVLTLALIGWSGSLHGHKGSEWTVRRYIEQASSGLLPLHTDFVRNQNQSGPAIDQFSEPTADNSPGGRDEIGVIEESTIGRLDTYRQGLQVWAANPLNFLFGVGYGSVGPELQQRFDENYSDKSLVNNQPIQIAVELGLVGIAIVSLIVWQFVRLVLRSRTSSQTKLMVAGLLLATVVQFQFYSALHLPQLWLVVALCLYLLNGQQSAKVKV